MASNKLNNGAEAGAVAPDTVPFVLMTRKGNKQQFKTLALPADSDFVQRIRTRDEVKH